LDYAILKAGLNEKIASLHNGLDTILGKLDNDEVELSIGEGQRLAIARAIASERPFIILDEPTASIDPIQERALYKLFLDGMKAKTSLIITHRLGAISSSDEILVVNNGYIAEQGTRKYLLSLNNGLFNQMVNAQREWYDV
jgi:ATP-binding cassette subfamily B protein